jgi:hypothetical protein
MAQYLLPCSCGQKVRVETAQAGGQVACGCGQALAVPTLRGLRALEEAAPDKAAIERAAGRQWSPLQGAMFSIGLLVAVVSLGVVGYTLWNYVQATPYTRDPSQEIIAYEGGQIDQLPAADSLDVFYEMRDQGLGEVGTPPWIQWQQVVAEQRTLMIGAGIAAAIGLLAAISAFFIKPARQVV